MFRGMPILQYTLQPRLPFSPGMTWHDTDRRIVGLIHPFWQLMPV